MIITVIYSTYIYIYTHVYYDFIVLSYFSGLCWVENDFCQGFWSHPMGMGHHCGCSSVKKCGMIHCDCWKVSHLCAASYDWIILQGKKRESRQVFSCVFQGIAVNFPSTHHTISTSLDKKSWGIRLRQPLYIYHNISISWGIHGYPAFSDPKDIPYDTSVLGNRPILSLFRSISP